MLVADLLSILFDQSVTKRFDTREEKMIKRQRRINTLKSNTRIRRENINAVLSALKGRLTNAANIGIITGIEGNVGTAAAAVNAATSGSAAAINAPTSGSAAAVNAPTSGSAAAVNAATSSSAATPTSGSAAAMYAPTSSSAAATSGSAAAEPDFKNVFKKRLVEAVSSEGSKPPQKLARTVRRLLGHTTT